MKILDRIEWWCIYLSVVAPGALFFLDRLGKPDSAPAWLLYILAAAVGHNSYRLYELGVERGESNSRGVDV